MSKWIESTLAAMIWSWLMVLLLLQKAAREKQPGRQAYCSPVCEKKNRLRVKKLPVGHYNAEIRA